MAGPRDLNRVELVEVNGEYALRIEHVGTRARVYVVADEALAGLLEALRDIRFGDRDCAALTEDGARQALLARIAALGGSVLWEDACTSDLEAAAFPLGYRGLDAIAALVECGALVAVRERGQPPRLRLTAVGAQGIA